MVKSCRNLQFILAIAAFGMLSLSFYFQYVDGLAPCALCLMQRLMVALLLLLFICGIFLHTRKLFWMELFIASAGLYFALRQVWLQIFMASTAHTCLPGFDVMVQLLPWTEIIYSLFMGTADCALNEWSFLGLGMPAWVAMYFSACIVVILSAVKSYEKI